MHSEFILNENDNGFGSRAKASVATAPIHGWVLRGGLGGEHINGWYPRSYASISWG
jgi:hypothetical protein